METLFTNTSFPGIYLRPFHLFISRRRALTSVFGDNLAYTDTTELEFGIKSRSFKSFRQAADENNWARFYGGIHFHHSCIVSTEYGKKVGQLVVKKLNMKKNYATK